MATRTAKAEANFCSTCKGSGKYDCPVTEYGAGKPKHSSFLMTCPKCNGVGYVSKARQAELDRLEAAWCRCAEADPYYVEFPGYHGWDCHKCGGVVQTG